MITEDRFNQIVMYFTKGILEVKEIIIIIILMTIIIMKTLLKYTFYLYIQL